MPSESKEKKQREPLSSYSFPFIIVFAVGVSAIVCLFFTPSVTPATLPSILDSSMEDLIVAAKIAFFLLICSALRRRFFPAL